MNIAKTLAFTGLRPYKMPFKLSDDSLEFVSLKMAIQEQVVKLIEEQNVRHMISGMALGIDQVCAEIVLELKKQYFDLILEAALPCRNQDKLWGQKDKERYRSILRQCDQMHLTSEEYTDDCMILRNKYMVDSADFLLAVWNGKVGGTQYTVNLARKMNIPVFIIDPSTLSI